MATTHSTPKATPTATVVEGEAHALPFCSAPVSAEGPQPEAEDAGVIIVSVVVPAEGRPVAGPVEVAVGNAVKSVPQSG